MGGMESMVYYRTKCSACDYYLGKRCSKKGKHVRSFVIKLGSGQCPLRGVKKVVDQAQQSGNSLLVHTICATLR